MKNVLKAAILTSAGVAAPVLLVLLVFGAPIMALYGEAFASRGSVLQVTALTAGLLAIQVPVGNLIAASGRMWLGAAMNGGWAIVLLLSTWFLLERGWGADGVATAFLVAYLCHALWTFWFAGQTLRRMPTYGTPSDGTVE